MFELRRGVPVASDPRVAKDGDFARSRSIGFEDLERDTLYLGQIPEAFHNIAPHRLMGEKDPRLRDPLQVVAQIFRGRGFLD